MLQGVCSVVDHTCHQSVVRNVTDALQYGIDLLN